MNQKEIYPQIRAKIKTHVLKLLEEKQHTTMLNENERGVNYMYTETNETKRLDIYFRGRVELFKAECGCNGFNYNTFSSALRNMKELSCSITVGGVKSAVEFEYEQSWLSVTASKRKVCKFCEVPVNKRKELVLGSGVYIDHLERLARHGSTATTQASCCPICERKFDKKENDKYGI